MSYIKTVIQYLEEKDKEIKQLENTKNKNNDEYVENENKLKKIINEIKSSIEKVKSNENNLSKSEKIGLESLEKSYEKKIFLFQEKQEIQKKRNIIEKAYQDKYLPKVSYDNINDSKITKDYELVDEINENLLKEEIIEECKKLNTIKEFNSNLKLNNQIFDFKNLQQISDQINLINNSNLQLDSSKLKKKKEDILTIKKEIKKKKIKIDDITSAINEKKKNKIK
jgi:hypothetical protein